MLGGVDWELGESRMLGRVGRELGVGLGRLGAGC